MYTYLLEMSSSWNFPARASPSYEGSEPSWGTSIFELKPSWQYWQYVCQKIANSSQFCFCTMILINFMPIYLNLCSTKGVFRVELYDLGTSFSHFQNKFIIKVNFSSFLANFQFRAEVKKVTSRAEPSWKSSDSSLLV